MSDGAEWEAGRPEEVPDFPPYKYVSGGKKQALSDTPHGRRALEAYRPRPLVPEQWRTCGAYLFGIDLFNRGDYWESHEEWESLWVLAGRSGATADFLKGLIKLAAAGVKCRQDRINGVARHAARAMELFESVRTETGAERYAGLSLPGLIEESGAVQAGAERGEFPGDRCAAVIYRFRLEPE